MDGVLVFLMVSIGFNIYQLVRNWLIKYDLVRAQERADDLCRDIKRLEDIEQNRISTLHETLAGYKYGWAKRQEERGK